MLLVDLCSSQPYYHSVHDQSPENALWIGFPVLVNPINTLPHVCAEVKYPLTGVLRGLSPS